MKITVEPKAKPEPKEIPYNDIEPGTVYQIVDGPIALKLKDGMAVLLNRTGSEDNYLEIARGHKGRPATKILGRIKEIIVEEI